MEIKVLQQEYEYSSTLFGCIGYERRSIHLLQTMASSGFGKMIFFDYKAEGVLSYDQNLSESADTIDFIHHDFDKCVARLLHEVEMDPYRSIAVDITSMDRRKLARLIVALFKHSSIIESISLFYCPATFRPPSTGFDVVTAFGPVLPHFMGNSVFLRENLSLIAGAGYEFGRIIGAIDSLEPKRVSCFMPIGTDDRYRPAVMRANLDFSFLEGNDALIQYDLSDTAALYYNLRRIVEEENTRSNVMILPLGPKIFAAISMVIGMILHPNIMIWRHSTVDPARPNSVTDAEAAGEVIQFSFAFQA